MPKQKLNQQNNRMCSMLVLLFQLLVTVSSVKLANTNGGANSGGGQRFAMEPQDQTAIVGSRVTLPCRVIGKNGWLQWTKDDFGLGTHRNLSGFERYSMVLLGRFLSCVSPLIVKILSESDRLVVTKKVTFR